MLPRFMLSVLRLTCSVCIMATVLTSCENDVLFESHTVQTQAEAGQVHLAVTLVAPWEDYIRELTPNFKLMPEQALSKVLPTTSVLEEKVLNALAASARVGLPQHSVTEKIVEATDADNKKTRTEETNPGTVPDAPTAAPGASKGARDLTGLPTEKRTVNHDPMLSYTAATALYQEVKLLNRYVTDAALRRKQRAYVVRLQLTVIPYAHHEPYDVHTTLGFFLRPPSDKRDRKDCKSSNTTKFGRVYVSPLLVTDNLEGLLKSRTVDTIRQLALAVSFMHTGVTGQIGVDKLRQALGSVLGTDLNSLLTVGRPTDNTLYVRLGAAQESTTRYAMVPRTHNITVVLMVPELFAGDTRDKGGVVSVTATTMMRQASTGRPFPPQNRDARLKMVEAIVSRHLGRPNLQVGDPPKNLETECTELEQERMCDAPSTGPSGDREDQVLNSLLGWVFKNDLEKFKLTLDCAGWGLKRRTDIWTEIAEKLGSSKFRGARFQLPLPDESKFPNSEQTVLLMDDGNNQMSAHIIGGSGLMPERMNAALTLELRDTVHSEVRQGETAKVLLPATSIDVQSGGRDPILIFQSPSVWKIAPLNLDGTRLMNAKLTLKHVQRDHWDNRIGPIEEFVTFKQIRYRLIGKSIPAVAIRRTVGFVKANASGNGKINVFVEFSKNAKNQPLAKLVELALEGAEIVKATSSSEGGLDIRLGKVTLTTDATLAYELRNLDKSTKLLLKAKAIDSEGKSIGNENTVAFDVKTN